MLAELRDDVAALLRPAFPDLDVYDRVPDDVNLLPCIVVGFPSASPSTIGEGVVFDIECEVYVIARRVDAGDPQGELVDLADAAWVALGGTRGTRSTLDRQRHVVVTRVTSQVVSIAGLDHDTYVLTTEQPALTC